MSQGDEFYNKAELRNLIRSAVSDGLREEFVNYGMDARDPIEMQKDFAYIRALRKASDATKRKAWLVFIGLLITSLLGFIGVSLKNGGNIIP